MKKNISYVFLSVFILLFASCTKKSDDTAAPKPVNTTTNANLRVTTDSVRFDGHYKNGNTKADSFFIQYYPYQSTKRPLIITFHGGGFTRGGLEQFELPYSRDGYIDLITNKFLKNNGFAYASANYRLLSTGDGIDMKETLNDCKDFVEYMRDNAAKYNIDPTKIILMGYSGGASVSLWLGLQNNFIQDVTIKGIIALNPQATLNILEWKDQVFVPVGRTSDFNDYTNPNFVLATSELFYSSTKISTINTYSKTHKLSFFNLFDSADPELYLACSAYYNDVIHHPAHCWALNARSINAGHVSKIQFIKVQAYTNPNFESIMQFCIRKFQ
jgi:predicted esterase